MKALAGLQDHQHVGGGDALPHDEELGEGEGFQVLDSRSCPTRASRSIRRRSNSSTRHSMCRRAACTARPRSASCWSTIRARSDFVVKPGSLGKPVPGLKLEVQRPDGTPSGAGRRRRADAVATRQLGDHQGSREDRRGRLFLSLRPRRRRDHLRRLDDERGGDREHDAQASEREGSRPSSACRMQRVARSSRHSSSATARPATSSSTSCRTFTRERLSQHEFPRHIAFVSELPKTPAGKVHRKVLRDREAAAAASAH